jgi:hypothetical protein
MGDRMVTSFSEQGLLRYEEEQPLAILVFLRVIASCLFVAMI